jgi:drug/metabolite transporter (DMT)-like permease
VNSIRRFLSPSTLLLVGLLAVSTSSTFIRLAQGAGVPSLAIAAYRLLFASLILWPIVIGRHTPELRALAGQVWLGAGLSGFFLGLHFATWISSLAFTSVASAVVLVDTTPLFVALIAGLFLRERLSRAMWVGLGIALVGGVIIALSGGGGALNLGARALLGDALALLGAITVGVYMVIGRAIQTRASFLVYIALTYTSAALTLWAAFFALGGPLVTYSPAAYGWLWALALIPQLIGHSSYNYALKSLPSTYVSLTVLGEPVGAIALAMLFLREFPSAWEWVGGALILGGIALASQKKGGTPG